MKMVKKTVIAVQIILMSILVSACSSTGSTETPEKAEENMSETEELSENMGEAAEEAGEEIGDEYADLPEGMYIPDPEDAQLLELTHFDYKYYMEPARVYTEKEMEVLQEKLDNDFEEVCVTSWNVSEYMELIFHVIADEEYHFVIGKAYKQKNNNLYIGNLLSYQDTVIGKFIVSYQGDELVVSVQYYDQERDREIGAFLKEGVHYYEQYTIPLVEKAIEKVGKPVVIENYSSYSGKWFENYLSFDSGFEDSYMELHISPAGEISGALSHYEGEEDDCSYAEFSGTIADGIGSAEYAEDGYGHSGSLTFTFCENGIILYVNEHGEPGFYGFNTGNNYYFRE